MPNLSARPMSLAARERLRDHQAVAAHALAAYSATSARLDSAVSRRAKIVAEQDALVAGANARLAISIGAVAQAMGADAAANVLCLTKTEVRRHFNAAKAHLAVPQIAESPPKASPPVGTPSEVPGGTKKSQAGGRVDGEAK